MTVSYYDQNGKAFFEDSLKVDTHGLHARFLAHVRPGGHILDAGCGSGRDALAFSQTGFSVTAFDASAEMVRLASRHSDLPILHMTFDEIEWRDTFDGVWACASLLHVPRGDLPGAFRRIAAALRPAGVFFTSFKFGTREREQDGRWFTDLTEPMLNELMQRAGLTILDGWMSDDLRPGRTHERWVSAIGRRTS